MVTDGVRLRSVVSGCPMGCKPRRHRGKVVEVNGKCFGDGAKV